jgi:hypothetical protein
MKNFRNYFKTHPFAGVTAALTFFLLLFLILMSLSFPAEGVNGFTSYIMAFEFARSVADINSLFTGMSPAEIKNVDVGNYLDFGFMITYSLFVAHLFVTASKVFERKWLLIGIPLAVIVLLCDFFENIVLLEITKNYLAGAPDDVFSQLLEKLHIVTWIKWGGLAFAFLLFSGILFTQRWFYFVLGVICALPVFFIIVLTNATPFELSVFTELIFLSFFALIIFSFAFKNADT